MKNGSGKFIPHCGGFWELDKSGKGKCGSCHKELPEKKTPRSFKKVSVGSHHDSFTMWVGLGLFLLVYPPFAGIQGLIRNGLASWDNLAATAIVMSMIIGGTILLVLFGGRKKKA